MEQISILIRSKEDFEKIVKIVPQLYLGWSENYLTKPTSVVFKDKKKSPFGVGSIGSAEWQNTNGFVIIDTNFNIVMK